MAAAIFVDTFHWIAEINPHDDWHVRCVEARKAIYGRRLVTSEEVLSELLDFFSGSGSRVREAAVATVMAIREDPGIVIVEQSHVSFNTALNLYARRLDKHYSMTDCSSMVIMTTEAILEVLTNDKHFTQEGFKTLPAA
jgi:predicted nucleic acid-binding protein